MSLFGSFQQKPVAVLAVLLLFVISAQTPIVAQSLDDRAEVRSLLQSGKRDAAIALAKKSVEVAEQKFGPDHLEVASWIDTLAEAYRLDRSFDELEPLYRRSLEIREKRLGPVHPDLAATLQNLAFINRWQGKHAEAEVYYLRLLSIYEATQGPNHANVATVLNELAALYVYINRMSEAQPLLERRLAIHEAASPPNKVEIGTALNALAVLYSYLKRYDEAQQLHNRARVLYELALGREHSHVATSLNNLAELYRAQGRFAEAEPLYKSAIVIYDTALGLRHSENPIRFTLSNLAELYESQGQWAEAKNIFRQIQANREGLLSRKGPKDARVTWSLEDTAQPSQMFGLYAEAENLYTAHLHGNEFLAKMFGTNVTKGEDGGSSYTMWFLEFIGPAWNLAKYGRDDSKLNETFKIAQRAYRSDAAYSLSLMAARGASGSTKLAALVRERQDLAAERNARKTSAGVGALEHMDKRIGEIDSQLTVEFPEYIGLTRPQPLSVGEAQALLSENEALILLTVSAKTKGTKEETFVWTVTKTATRWTRSELGREALTDEVSALRCGLDATLWDDDIEAARCRELVAGEPKRDGFGNLRADTLPFDIARAHSLYKALFAEIDDLIGDKHLLIVPSGPLTQLPFQTMVTAASAGSVGYKGVAWLARRNAVTVLPGAASLKALRRVGRPSAGTKPMIGFGNPLLEGAPLERAWEARWAADARERQICKELPRRQVAQVTKARGLPSVASRDGRVDVSEVRSLMPLPDTADEICAIAKKLKLAPDDIWLGARATETNIKRLSADSGLAQYRVVHFATHGAIAGEISGSTEPGLIFTPPSEATETDDGYLSASEISALKLDADWVILSACNTAAGGAKGAEALSGLARAFIYAGARALLVSHWAVDSGATVKLVTNAVGAVSVNAKIGRAEALRRAMLSMMDKGEPREAHPSYWAPFVVVGEGAAAK